MDTKFTIEKGTWARCFDRDHRLYSICYFCIYIYQSIGSGIYAINHRKRAFWELFESLYCRSSGGDRGNCFPI